MKKPHSQQKHAIRIVHNEAKFERTKGLFISTNTLNLYKLDKFRIAIFMHKVHTKPSPPVVTRHF